MVDYLVTISYTVEERASSDVSSSLLVLILHLKRFCFLPFQLFIVITIFMQILPICLFY